MDYKQITESFKLLIEKLEKILPVLNKYGSKLVEEKHYDEAREIISKAETMVSLQNKVKALQEEWQSLEVQTIEFKMQTEDMVEKDIQEIKKQFRSEPHLHNKDFRVPILQALVNLGGRSQRKYVFGELEKILADKLTENDWQKPPSNKKLTRWQTIATHTRTDLLNEGLITLNPQKGIWIITEKGRNALKGE